MKVCHFLFYILLIMGRLFTSSVNAQTYEIIDLGTTDGGFPIRAYGINNSGQVAGDAHTTVNGLAHALIWEDGVLTHLGTLPTGTASAAVAINDSGQAVGLSNINMAIGGFRDRAFLWKNDVMTNLGTLGGVSSQATSINNYGQVVGESQNDTGYNNAFLWENGVMTNLGNLPKGRYSKAFGINDSGRVVGSSEFTPNGTTHAFLWKNGVMIDLGTLGGFSSEAIDLNDSGYVVGKAATGVGFEHAFLWKNGVMKDLNALIDTNSGWVLSSARMINNAGKVIGNGTFNGKFRSFLWQNGAVSDINSLIDTSLGWVLSYVSAISDSGQIVGSGTHNGQSRGFILKPSQVTVISPKVGEHWIAGEEDTIRWKGSIAEQFLVIELSVDGGLTYTDIGFPTEEGYFIWTIPDSILSNKAKIRISNLGVHTTVLAVSDTFKIKGFVLTRFDTSGQYEAFKSNTHGWNYQNGTLWPSSWWTKFKYSSGNDPFTNGTYPNSFKAIPDSAFVDWPLWVDVFSVDSCYWSTTFEIYRGRAEEKWKRRTNVHNGSCFGFAASSFLAFNFKDQFFIKHPGIPDFITLFSLAINDDIRSTINRYYSYQFAKQSLDNDVIGQPKDPRTTLQEIKEMFIKDVTDIQTITIYNNGGAGGGAHTMAPIKLVKDNSGPSRYRLLLYDSNNPGTDNAYILIDSLNNTWTAFTGLGPTWTGSSHFYLEIPISNYLNTPSIGKKNLSTANSIKGSGKIEFYNTSKANVMYTASNGNKIGNVNGILTDELGEGIAIFDKNGKQSDPVGYYVADDSYSMTLSNMTDTSTNAFFTVIKDYVVYNYTRGNVKPSQVDRFSINDGFSVVSSDPLEKHINLKIIAEIDNSERIIIVRDAPLRQNDSLLLRQLGENNFELKNYGTAKSYDLEINERSLNGQAVFEHLSIPLGENSSHIVKPDWDSLDHKQVSILIDNGNNGVLDDSILVVNQTTDVGDRGSLVQPSEYHLAQNYPNPFNPTTTIKFQIPLNPPLQRGNATKSQGGFITLKVYDILGREVATLANEERKAGLHSVQFDASRLSTGVYIYTLRAGSYIASKKLLLLK